MVQQQKELSKKEYDREMRKEVERLKREGRMPSLEDVMQAFRESLKKHKQ